MKKIFKTVRGLFVMAASSVIVSALLAILSAVILACALLVPPAAVIFSLWILALTEEKRNAFVTNLKNKADYYETR